MSWALDGKTVRTIQKAKQTDQRFPQTPSRVQFSVWPAGISSSPQGVSFGGRRKRWVLVQEESTDSINSRCGAQTIDWAGGMIDWKDPTYVAQGNAFKAHVQWVDIQCYSGSDLNLPFVQGNSSSSSNSTKRLRERELWPRAQAINSYIYGSESSFRSRLSLLFVCRGRGPRSYRQWRADQFTERSQQLGRSDWRQRLERRDDHQLGLLDRPEQ